ncbi:MAG: gamma carbonic anhydrase family protein [Gemmatimonadaceae bacterium]
MKIHRSAYVHERATVIGDVTLGAQVSVWPTAVIRADTAPITIGAQTNVQDGAVIHVDQGVPAAVGERVTIGHRAIVHGATIADDCLIGMGAILLNNVHVGRGCVVAAGAVCKEGMRIPEDSLVVGVPARVARHTSAADRERIARAAAVYVALQEEYKRGSHQAHVS